MHLISDWLVDYYAENLHSNEYRLDQEYKI